MFNGNIFVVTAIPRSGHTAFCYWLAAQQRNDCNYLPDNKLQNFTHRGYTYHANEYAAYFILENEQPQFLPRTIDEINKILMNDGIVIFDRQNYPVVQHTTIPKDLANYKWHDIIFMRDCYNNFASLAKFLKNQKGLHKYQKYWIEHAKEVCGQTKTINNENITFVSYNKWSHSTRERIQINNHLGTFFTDQYIDRVSPNGNGSSFDGHSFDKMARMMEVHTRHWDMHDKSIYLDFVNNQEMVDLNYQLFKLRAPDYLGHLNPWWYRTYRKYKTWKKES